MGALAEVCHLAIISLEVARHHTAVAAQHETASE